MSSYEVWGSWLKLWLKALGNGMCEEGRDCEICNHDEGNQHPKDQEDLTKESLEKIWRLWWNSRKDRDP